MDEFRCDPSDCIPSPEFPWVKWPENETSYYPPTEGYFNLNPQAFGLSYDIFEEEVIVEQVDGKLTSIITGNWASQTSLTHFPASTTSTLSAATTSSYSHYGKKRDTGKRGAGHMNAFSKRDDTIIPALCYDICNDCYLEAQRVGKTSALCAAGSAFETSYTDCNGCIVDNGGGTKDTSKTYLDPKFAQFVNYCNAQAASPQPVQESSTVPQTQQNSPPPVQTTTQAPPNTQTSLNPITTTTSTPPPPETTESPTESTSPTATASGTTESPTTESTTESATERPTESTTETPTESTSPTASPGSGTGTPQTTGASSSTRAVGGGGSTTTTSSTSTSESPSTVSSTTSRTPSVVPGSLASRSMERSSFASLVVCLLAAVFFI
jgi:hypothetical protein